MRKNKINNKIKTVLLLLFVSVSAFAQKQRNVFIDFLGSGTFGPGVYYDMRFGANTKWGGRIGLGYTYSTDTNFFESEPTKTQGVNIPLAVNYLIGNKIHNLEVGLGFNYSIYHASYNYLGKTTKSSENLSGLATFLDLGYRYQSSADGVMFRIGVTPTLPLTDYHSSVSKERNTTRGLYINPYVSVGINF